MLGQKAGEALVAFAGGPIGTVIAVLSALDSLRTFTDDLGEADRKRREAEQKAWDDHVLNPKRWTYKKHKQTRRW